VVGTDKADYFGGVSVENDYSRSSRVPADCGVADYEMYSPRWRNVGVDIGEAGMVTRYVTS